MGVGKNEGMDPQSMGAQGPKPFSVWSGSLK